MNPYRFIPFLYASMLGILGIALLAKWYNAVSMLQLFTFSMIFQLIFAILSIWELRNSEQLSNEDKRLWTRLLLASPLIFGMPYLKKIRRKIYFY